MFYWVKPKNEPDWVLCGDLFRGYYPTFSDRKISYENVEEVILVEKPPLPDLKRGFYFAKTSTKQEWTVIAYHSKIEIYTLNSNKQHRADDFKEIGRFICDFYLKEQPNVNQ